jgi:hypothetical protein
METSDNDNETVISPEQARGGSRITGRVFVVLLSSLALSLLAMVVLFAVYLPHAPG